MFCDLLEFELVVNNCINFNTKGFEDIIKNKDISIDDKKMYDEKAI